MYDTYHAIPEIVTLNTNKLHKNNLEIVHLCPKQTGNKGNEKLQNESFLSEEPGHSLGNNIIEIFSPVQGLCNCE